MLLEKVLSFAKTREGTGKGFLGEYHLCLRSRKVLEKTYEYEKPLV